MKVLFLFLLFSIATTSVQAQFKIPTSASFFDFVDSFYYYHHEDSAEGGYYNQVRRDKITWGTRLAPSGNMSKATKARIDYAKIYLPTTASSPPNYSNTKSNTTTVHPLSQPWRELGPIRPIEGGNTGKGMGQIHRLGFHPNFGNGNQIMYAGSHYGGLFRSDDGGDNWFNYHTDRGLPITSIGGIAVSQNHVFICTGNGDHGYSQFGFQALYAPLRGSINNFNPIHTHGVYRIGHHSNLWVSINGRVTLIDGTPVGDLRTAFELGGTMRQIVVHPTNENILLIATSLGIFRTQDGGANWQQVIVGKSLGNNNYALDTEWRGIVFQPNNPSVVYASGKDIYKSIDGGITWTLLVDHTNLPAPYPSNLTIQRTNLAVTPAASGYLYAYAVGTKGNPTSGTVMLYNDTTSSWRLLTSDTTSDPFNSYKSAWTSITVSPTNPNLVYNTLTKVRGSHTALSAINWKDKSPYNNATFHADVHEVHFPPNNPNFVYAATHGGVSKKDITNLGTDSWTALYNGLGVATIWSFDDWEGNDSIILMANQDVGIHHTINKGTNWYSSNSGGDGFTSRVEDQSGKVYLQYNTYAGVSYIDSNILRQYSDPVVGRSNGYLPLDFVGNPDTFALYDATFPVVNHPKDDQVYVGFSELYTNLTCGLDYTLVRRVPDTTFQLNGGDTLQISGLGVDATGTLVSYPNQVRRRIRRVLSGIGTGSGRLSNHCAAVGTIVDTVHFYPPPNNSTFDYAIDTICVITPYYDTIISSRNLYAPNLTNAQVTDSIWKVQSNLKNYFTSKYNRRILELAFSEDEQTNYTYLATLGDVGNGNRRCDFYRKDGNNSMLCDTCVERLTANVPISDTTYSRDPNPITGIAVDPLDGNRVWLSFSGFDQQIKVYYSADAGNTWQNYDDANQTLAKLNMPINHIVYQRRTNDRLYIATDVGIYVREGNGNWQRMSENFPNVRTSELKINYCVGKLRAATFGRGAWEVDLLPENLDEQYRSYRTITGTEIWKKDKQMTRDIRVTTGSKLILEDMTLNMPKGGLIIVEQGATLQVTNSTITNRCSQTWQGIEVWGNSQKAQSYINKDHGRVVLQNATISYAKQAIANWKVGDYQATGGIINAYKTTFLNNWRAVEMIQYHSPNNQADLSTFIDCQFVANDQIRTFDNGSKQFLGHMSMWAVDGLKIRGCRFLDERTDKLQASYPAGNYGIYGLGATPNITSHNPSPLSNRPRRNTFQGLGRGIALGNAASSRFSSVIDQCDFVANKQGIDITAHNDVKIVRNTFEVGAYDNNGNGHYGTSLLHSWNYVVEQNKYTLAAASPAYQVRLGVWVDNSGSSANRIYNNGFENIEIANLVHGNNSTNSSTNIGGLRFECNASANAVLDYSVNKASNSNITASIATQQGSPNSSAGNKFSYPLNTNFGINWHFYNEGPAIQYYSPSSGREFPTKVYGVGNFPSPFSSPNTCPVNYSNTGIINIQTNEGAAIKIDFLKHQFGKKSVLYNELLQSIGKQKEPTEEQQIYSELNETSSAMTQLSNEIIFRYRQDTTNLQWDSIAAWIAKKPADVGIAYELVEHWWKRKKHTMALDILQQVPDKYTLSEQELQNQVNYVQLKKLLYEVYQDNRNEAQLHRAEYNQLQDIAQKQYGFAAVTARSIIQFFYDQEIELPQPTIPAEVEQRVEEKELTIVSTLYAYPAIAHHWLDIKYYSTDYQASKLVVYNSAGIIVTTAVLKQPKGIWQLDTTKLKAGKYTIRLLQADQTILSDTFLIQHAK